MMRTYGILTAVCAVLTLGAATASAQDAPKVGLTLSSGSLGIHVPVGDNAAIRPTLGFSRSTTDYEGSQFINESVTGTSLVPGASVLFYTRTWDTTRLYLSPQYTYARHSSNLDGDEPEGTHSAALMLGVQHGLGARFGIFAETGLGWSRSKTTSSGSAQSSVTTNTWGSRTAIGGLLFF